MQNSKWFQSLCDQIEEYTLIWNLEEQETAALRDWVLSLCRDQFKAGNRSGVAWALDQARQKIAKGETV